MHWLRRNWWPSGGSSVRKSLNIAFRLGLIATGVCIVVGVASPYKWIPAVVVIVALLIELPLAARDHRARRNTEASA
jgi:hypothetical protein